MQCCETEPHKLTGNDRRTLRQSTNNKFDESFALHHGTVEFSEI